MNPHILRPTPRAAADDSETGGETGGTLAQAKQAITSTARDTAARLKSVASDAADRAKNQAQRAASETKEGAADRIGGYSSAMHDSAKSFEQQDPNIAWAAHNVADRVQRAADYIRNTDLATMRTDVENFARRHPLAFFGGLLIGGLVVGNLLKATAQEASAAEEDLSSTADENWDAGNESGSNEGLSDAAASAGI